MQPSLVVHGGAWDIPDAMVDAHIRGCRAALSAGWSLLEEGASSLDAVQAAIVVLENDPTFDAGRGAGEPSSSPNNGEHQNSRSQSGGPGMRTIAALTIVMMVCQTNLFAQKALDFQPLVNDLSLYKNYLDSGSSAGQTLQIISINQLKLMRWFQFELTADFNHHLTPGYTTDYYLEAGVLTYVTKRFAINYQRIYGTFVGKPVNQIGVRCSF